MLIRVIFLIYFYIVFFKRKHVYTAYTTDTWLKQALLDYSLSRDVWHLLNVTVSSILLLAFRNDGALNRQSESDWSHSIRDACPMLPPPLPTSSLYFISFNWLLVTCHDVNYKSDTSTIQSSSTLGPYISAFSLKSACFYRTEISSSLSSAFGKVQKRLLLRYVDLSDLLNGRTLLPLSDICGILYCGFWLKPLSQMRIPLKSGKYSRHFKRKPT